MAYTPYFKDRIVQYPGRVKLTNIDTGEAGMYTMERSEGTVTQEGTPLDAESLDYGTTLGNVQLDTTAGSDTTDGQLYANLVALGWTDCIE